MSLIKNLIKEPKKQSENSKNDEETEENWAESRKPRHFIKNATDLQRHRLEKLMKNPDKPVILPEQRREKDYMQAVPSFVRNVMGSSAGAGSGEFHVYRHLRRKEYARQKTIQAKSAREQLDDDYQHKLEENRRAAEEKTAKKRAKRMKRKQRTKRQRKGNESATKKDETETSDQSSGEHEDDAADVPIEPNVETCQHTIEGDASDESKKPGAVLTDQPELADCSNDHVDPAEISSEVCEETPVEEIENTAIEVGASLQKEQA